MIESGWLIVAALAGFMVGAIAMDISWSKWADKDRQRWRETCEEIRSIYRRSW